MARGETRFFGDPAPIQRDYLVDEFREDARHFELLGSVHVQVGVADGDAIKETEWLETVAEKNGLPSAIVAYCDLSKKNAYEQLQRQKSHSHVRGIRQIVGRSIEEDQKTGSDGLLDDAVWQENLTALVDLHLSFDLQLVPTQALRVAELLATMPALPVALCHCGSPSDHSLNGRRQWREGIQALAALPNVSCKISGLGMFNHHWTIESIRPYVETCIDLFGVSRSMFASNFPVDKLHRSYTEIWRAFETLTNGLSDSEQAALFANNAASFYRI